MTESHVFFEKVGREYTNEIAGKYRVKRFPFPHISMKEVKENS
jgi:hypothetical protein